MVYKGNKKENQILLKILGKELYGKFDKYNRHLTSEYTIVILLLKATSNVTRIVFCTGLIDQRQYQYICKNKYFSSLGQELTNVSTYTYIEVKTRKKEVYHAFHVFYRSTTEKGPRKHPAIKNKRKTEMKLLQSEAKTKIVSINKTFELELKICKQYLNIILSN